MSPWRPSVQTLQAASQDRIEQHHGGQRRGLMQDLETFQLASWWRSRVHPPSSRVLGDQIAPATFP